MNNIVLKYVIDKNRKYVGHQSVSQSVEEKVSRIGESVK